MDETVLKQLSQLLERLEKLSRHPYRGRLDSGGSWL